MAGIAAANTNNSTGIAGIDWNAQIIDQAWGDDQQTANAIMDAVNGGAQIINNSYAHCQPGTCNDPVPQPRYSTTVRIAFADAYKMNVVAAASMGNYNTSDVYYPAGNGQGIIAVGATNQNDRRWEFSNTTGSNTGNHIDVTAPGVDIISTIATGGYAPNTGTSMAAPHISGIAGLLLAQNPNLYNDDIEQIIRLSADDRGPTGFDPEYGTGRVNAHQALQLLRSPYVLEYYSTTGGSIYATSSSFNMYIYGASGIPDGYYRVKRREIRRNVSFPYKDNVQVWGRGVATTGWNREEVAGSANHNFAMGFCEPVPGTVTGSGATLRTYIYEVKQYNYLGQLIKNYGWQPATESNVQFAYTVHGKPGTPPLSVSIFGPQRLTSGEQGTWSANVSNGTSPYSYLWEKRTEGDRYWYHVGWDASYTGSDTQDFDLKVTVTDAKDQEATDQMHVTVSGAIKKAPPSEEITLEESLPETFDISQNYPNPFNPATTIRYALPEQAKVRLDVYNILGRRVVTLVNGSQSANFYEVRFDGQGLASGLYIARLQAAGQSGQQFVKELKMQMIK